MKNRRVTQMALGCAMVTGLLVAGTVVTGEQAAGPLSIGSGKVSIAGTSNVHDYSAATTTIRLTQVRVTSQATGAALWNEVVTPGVLQAFSIVVPAETLTSGDKGLDKNMYKALMTAQHPDISFALTKLDAGATPAVLRATGTLTLAGVKREVAFDIATQVRNGLLVVTGTVPLVMTDYGVKPPKAMLGMLKTDPKVTVTFEVALAAVTSDAVLQ